MAALLTNNGVSTLASSIAAGATSITVQAGHGARFPSPSGGDWFPVTLLKESGQFEICRCTARSGDVLTVTRAQEGTTALYFSANDRVELRNTAAVMDEKYGPSYGQLAGMRNRIINGDFRIWQRGTSFASVGNTYVADRWRVATTGTSLTVDWGNNAQVLAAFGAAGNTSFGITQSIEAGNSYDMAGKTVTMAVTVDSPSYSGPISFNLYRLTTRDSLSGMALVGTVGFTGPYSVRRLSAQFNIPSSGNLGLYIEVVATSGITSGVLTFKEVQLEIGPVATPFEHRPYGVELALCKRYFQKYTYGFIAYTTAGSGYGDNLMLPVEMMATPTVTTVPSATLNVNNPAVIALNKLSIANSATAITTGVCVNSGTVSLSAEL